MHSPLKIFQELAVAFRIKFKFKTQCPSRLRPSLLFKNCFSHYFIFPLTLLPLERIIWTFPKKVLFNIGSLGLFFRVLTPLGPLPYAEGSFLLESFSLVPMLVFPLHDMLVLLWYCIFKTSLSITSLYAGQWSSLHCEQRCPECLIHSALLTTRCRLLDQEGVNSRREILFFGYLAR